MKLLTVKEVAELLSVGAPRIYEMAKQGILPSVRLGRQIRFSEQALQDWIANGGQSLPGGWRRDPDGEGATQ